MSYLCGICGSHVPYGAIQRRYVIKRPDGQTEREVPVCEDCAAGLRSGYTLDQMRQMCGPKPNGKPLLAVQQLAAAHKAKVGSAPSARPVVKGGGR